MNWRTTGRVTMSAALPPPHSDQPSATFIRSTSSAHLCLKRSASSKCTGLGPGRRWRRSSLP
jgi:hypothetical protein